MMITLISFCGFHQKAFIRLKMAKGVWSKHFTIRFLC